MDEPAGHVGVCGLLLLTNWVKTQQQFECKERFLGMYSKVEEGKKQEEEWNFEAKLTFQK